ncbi:MAG: hypothetical protein LBM02_03985 [Lachnospiraceae bacterium]|jgi:hypothetical protein|nr:hypothetical protein [Lachnospiraceae bacterium]
MEMMIDKIDQRFYDMLDKTKFATNEKYASLKNFGRIIGNRTSTFHTIYRVMYKEEVGFIDKNPFGTGIIIKFDYVNKRVALGVYKIEVILPYDEFVEFLSIVDINYSPIIPLYSFVELDEKFLDEDLQEMFKGRKQPYIVITARKIKLPKEFENYIIDYLGRIWPYGEEKDNPPIIISNMMVKRVVSTGISGEGEEIYSEKFLRKEQIEKKLISTAFMSEKFLDKYERDIGNIERKLVYNSSLVKKKKLNDNLEVGLVF